jgi:PAS domain-containing protein
VQPDVILLDLGLPAGDGFLVMERLRNFPSLASIPIVVLTARDPETARQRAMVAGAIAFLRKPVDHEQLFQAIRRAVGTTSPPRRRPHRSSARRRVASRSEPRRTHVTEDPGEPMNEPAPRESVENPSQPEPNLRLVPPPSPAAPFPLPPHSLRLRVVGAWLRTLGLALAGLLMVVAAFASIMNLNRVKGLVQEMGQSREILVRLECAENDLLMLDTFAHVPVPSAAERQQAQQRRQHLDGELRQIAGLTDGNVEMHRMWGGLWEEFEHALRLLDDAARNHNHATLHGRAGTHNFDTGFDRIHDKVAHLELISAHQWRERTQGMIAWMGASGVATGVAASLGLALLLVLGIVLHRLTRMLESRVRQRTAQLEASIRGNREAQQRLEIAIEGTGVGFWEWNVRENVIRWDAKMFRLYGLEPTSDGIVPYEAWRSAVHRGCGRAGGAPATHGGDHGAQRA